MIYKVWLIDAYHWETGEIVVFVWGKGDIKIAQNSDWLAGADRGDVVVLQGEAGSTFALVDFAFQKRAYSGTRGKQTGKGGKQEREKGLGQYEFEHICFRRYRYFRDW